MDEIKRQARDRDYNSFHFSFSGGEPTLHPGYLEILKHYSDDAPNSNYQSCHMTTNLSPGIPWFKKYVEATKDLHRVSVTASWHREFGNKEQFREKLIFLQENDVQVTVNMVMVPEWFDMIWDEALYFQEPGINVTLKPQSNSNATKVVDTYTPEQLDILYNGMPQRDYTKARLDALKKQSKRPAAKSVTTEFMEDDNINNSKIPQIMQMELTDDKDNKYYIDQAERLNSMCFNSFTEWSCEAGYRSIIIREPDGNIKRSYSCWDQPLGNIETGFKLFETPMKCITPTCVSSADSKIPKWKNI